ncbi:hypothetical protein Thu_207 [Bacillus phage Thurquoise]|uniref:Uncharacterized protein n=1 Tax=Bacillus phage Deep Blue TaxID=1792245 RepID=A0A140HLP0_9CAUD|nr:hypothetical protein Blue_079 [Bacillus phage Deep Blue]AMO25902.1 hypothetical protein Blue_079 [Bacillus phage Deep Blue]UXQ89050.1 hypothetical protein Thu_207 [Bacillus phage Thurquoise]
MSMTTAIILLNTTMLLTNATVNAIQSILLYKELKRRVD